MPADRSLYLVRHAPAVKRGDAWPDDSLRPLTEEGATRMRQVVRGLRVLDADIDLVLTSPFVRAVETASILVRGLDPKPDIVQFPPLAPGGTAARVVEALAAHGKARRIALVGHEPGLGDLVAWLIGARAPIPLKKAGVCRIDLSEWPPSRQNVLAWLATAKILKSLD